MPLQFKNSEGQVFSRCLGGINYCLYLYCGNSYKLVKHRVRLDFRKYFYANRVVNVWNCLNDNVVCSHTLHEFVLKLDRVNLSSFLKGRAHI